MRYTIQTHKKKKLKVSIQQTKYHDPNENSVKYRK